MRFVTDEAIQRLMVNNKHAFVTKKEVQGTLPTDKITLNKTEDVPQIIQSAQKYTDTFQKNFKEQPKITDMAPSDVGFTLISGAHDKRSNVIQDTTKENGQQDISNDYIDTQYSVIAMSDQQHNGMGQERRDIESSAMVYVGGGTAAFVAKAKTQAAAGHLALYEGKEAEKFGTEINTIYTAPDIGTTMTRDTIVDDDRFSASARYDAQSLYFSGKKKFKVNDSAKNDGATCFLSAEKLEFKSDDNKITIDAAGFELNGVRKEFDANRIFRVNVDLSEPERVLAADKTTIDKYYVRVESPKILNDCSDIQLRKESAIRIADKDLRKVENVPNVDVAVQTGECYLIMSPDVFNNKISAEAKDANNKFFIMISNPIMS